MSLIKKIREAGADVAKQAAALKFKAGGTTFTISPDTGNIVLVYLADFPSAKADVIAIPLADFEKIVEHFNKCHCDNAEEPAKSLASQGIANAQGLTAGADGAFVLSRKGDGRLA